MNAVSRETREVNSPQVGRQRFLGRPWDGHVYHHAGVDDPDGHHLTEIANKPVQTWQLKPRIDQYKDTNDYLTEMSDFLDEVLGERQMENIENGMLVGADAEWERLNADTPYDKAGTPQMESYLFDRDRVREVVTAVCGIDTDDITEDAAAVIYDHLVRSEAEAALKAWFASEDRAKYDEWWHDRNDWMKEGDC